jgi:hypothetical protein
MKTSVLTSTFVPLAAGALLVWLAVAHAKSPAATGAALAAQLSPDDHASLRKLYEELHAAPELASQ